MIESVAVIGPGRIGRQIGLACALGGCRVALVDVKARSATDARALFDGARREIARDLRLMVEEDVLKEGDVAPAMDRIEARRGLDGLDGFGFVQEALPERVDLKREILPLVSGATAPDAIIASTSSTISPSHLVDAVKGPERFLVAHWLNPAHIIPLVEVSPSPLTAPMSVERTLGFLEDLGKVAVRCGDSPGFIGSRMQALLMNEAVRLVEEGVATPEDVDRALRAGLGFRYAAVGIFEFIDSGGVDVLYHASRFLAAAFKDKRFEPAKLVEEKIARSELGPKTGCGFFDYTGDRRESFETAKVRALLRQLRAGRPAPRDRPARRDRPAPRDRDDR